MKDENRMGRIGRIDFVGRIRGYFFASIKEVTNSTQRAIPFCILTTDIAKL
jgi:hypothetical protein